MPSQIPLEFPAVYRGQFVLIDFDREEAAARYTWGVRILPDGGAHIVGRQKGNRRERSLVSVASGVNGIRFTHVNGDPMDCTGNNLRCMNPRKFLKERSIPYPGPTSDDADYRIHLENKKIDEAFTKPPRKRRRLYERPEF